MKPFFYDVLIKHRPWLPELLLPNVEYLRERGIKSIISCDEKPLVTHFLRYLHQSFPPLHAWLSLVTSPEDPAAVFEAVQSHPRFMTAFQASYLEYCALLNFELAGKKVFYFNGTLVDKLTVTLADAPSELLRLPFPSCFFVIDYPPFLELYETITNSEKMSSDIPLSVSLTESEDSDGIHITFFVSRPNYATFTNPDYIKRSWLISSGRKVEDALRTEWPFDPTDPSANVDDDLRFLSHGHLVFFRTLANCILYLSSRTADLAFEASPLNAEIQKLRDAGKRWRKIAKKRLSPLRSQHSRLDYVHVGGTITVAPFRSFLTSEGIEGVKRVLLKRLMVRGHWRNQAYGPRSTLRKLVFIEPYWRGPELADEVNKPYEVKL